MACSNDGGYDYEFVDEVPDDLVCTICQYPMKNPVQTHCGHRFCRPCLEASLRRFHKCPIDRQPLTSQQFFNDLATDRAIRSLKVKCPQRSNCAWQGEINNVQAHVQECSTDPCRYADVGCSFMGIALEDHYKMNMEKHLSLVKDQHTRLTQQNQKLENKIAQLEVQKNECFQNTEKIQRLEKKIRKLKKHASRLTIMTQEDQSLFSFVWKIDDFSKHLKNAKEQDRDIYSEPFYIHQNGYKIRLMLRPNGQGTTKGTHVSIFMIIMKGEYDAILAWPFNWKYRFILIDQKQETGDRKNIAHHFVDPNSNIRLPNYKRPTTDENIGRGIPKFVSHERLRTENYVQDGTIFIKFEIKKR